MEPPVNFPDHERLEKRIEHPCFPQPSSVSMPVWRYLDLAKLVSLLKTRTLYFTRIDQFSDPYEGTTTPRTAEGIGEFLRRNGARSDLTEVLGFYENSRKGTFVSCWHANEHESEAMWRLYCGDHGGVAVRSTYGALLETIRWQQGVYIGQVRYVDYGVASFPDANAFYPVMHKRAAFAHEREVRIVRYLPESPTEDQPTGLTLAVDLSAVCHAIFVSPSASRYYFDAVKAVIEALAPGLEAQLSWSQMNTPPLRAAG